MAEKQALENDASPPYQDNDSDLGEGIYVIVNKATRTVLDLAGGNAKNCTKVQGWERVHNKWFGDTRWILRRTKDATWTLVNLKSATFLDLMAGRKENGSPVIGHGYKATPPNGSLNQEWHLKAQRDGFHTLQSRAAGTFLELENRSSTNGTQAVCSALIEGNNNQLWELERASRTVEDIVGLLGDWNEPLLSRVCRTHSLDSHCFVLPDELRKTIWNGTGLRTQPFRKDIYDYDHFVTKTKDAMVSWVRDDFKTEGYALLFGIIYGQSERGPNAYNWYLTQDMESLLFFDAQSGMEFTPASLTRRGFKPSFAIL